MKHLHVLPLTNGEVLPFIYPSSLPLIILGNVTKWTPHCFFSIPNHIFPCLAHADFLFQELTALFTRMEQFKLSILTQPVLLPHSNLEYNLKRSFNYSSQIGSWKVKYVALRTEIIKYARNCCRKASWYLRTSTEVPILWLLNIQKATLLQRPTHIRVSLCQQACWPSEMLTWITQRIFDLSTGREDSSLFPFLTVHYTFPLLFQRTAVWSSY